jgi:hypothetical protein
MNDGACLQRFLLLYQPMARSVGAKASLSGVLASIHSMHGIQTSRLAEAKETS